MLLLLPLFLQQKHKVGRYTNRSVVVVTVKPQFAVNANTTLVTVTKKGEWKWKEIISLFHTHFSRIKLSLPPYGISQV